MTPFGVLDLASGVGFRVQLLNFYSFDPVQAFLFRLAGRTPMTSKLITLLLTTYINNFTCKLQAQNYRL